MLVPQDVALSAAVAYTCVTGLEPDSVRAGGDDPAPPGASHNPPAIPAAAATTAAVIAVRQVRAGRARTVLGREAVRPGGRSPGSRPAGTWASSPGSGVRRASSARHAAQPGR